MFIFYIFFWILHLFCFSAFWILHSEFTINYIQNHEKRPKNTQKSAKKVWQKIKDEEIIDLYEQIHIKIKNTKIWYQKHWFQKKNAKESRGCILLCYSSPWVSQLYTVFWLQCLLIRSQHFWNTVIYLKV